MSLKAFANSEYPYGDTIEGLYYKRLANGVDIGVVFPFTPELHFDLSASVRTGRLVATSEPISAARFSEMRAA